MIRLKMTSVFNSFLKLNSFRIYLTFVFVVFLSVFFFSPNFSSNDDTEVRNILDGTRYGKPDFHIWPMNSIFTYAMTKLYENWNSVYWYELILYFLTILSYAILINFISKFLIRVKPTLSYTCLLAVYTLYFSSLNSISYTNTAIVLVGTSVILFSFAHKIYSVNPAHKIFYFMSIFILFSIGYLIRPRAALLTILFLAPTVIFSLLKNRYLFYKTSLVLFTFLFSWIYWIIDRLLYSGESWQQYYKFYNNFVWPVDSNLLYHSVKTSKSELLTKLNMTENQFNLWIDANHIDLEQFPRNFTNSLTDITLHFDINVLLGPILDMPLFHFFLLFFLGIFLFSHRPSKNLGIDNLLTSWHKNRTYFESLFQYLYSLIFLIFLFATTKNVHRVSDGLFLILIILGVAKLSLVTTSTRRVNNRFELFNSFVKLHRFLVPLVIIVSFVFYRGSPDIRFMGKDQFIPEYEVAKYLDTLPQCLGSTPSDYKCVLFSHTARIQPFTRPEGGNVRHLYLFWSAFSPLWEDSVLQTGKRNSLDLICSNTGFVLNSYDQIITIKNYILETRGVSIDVVPVNSIGVLKNIVDPRYYLTLGSNQGGC